MKNTLSNFAVAAIFSAAAFSSVAGTASAQSPVAGPVAGMGDHMTGLSGTPSQQKERQARTAEAIQLAKDAAVDLYAGKYALAEMEARQSLSLSDGGVADEVLASSLEAQGKDQEALEHYHIMVVDQKASYPRVLLPYAQLLLKSGQWAEAVAVYNQALPSLPDVSIHRENPFIRDSDLIAANSHFSADVPEPAVLATALHIARGMVYSTSTSWSGDAQNKEAMEEYRNALQLAPDNALTNYFYGVGWQKLTLVERAKFGTVQQAKAHLRKAEKVGSANVKAAAARALKALG